MNNKKSKNKILREKKNQKYVSRKNIEEVKKRERKHESAAYTNSVLKVTNSKYK